MKCMDNHVPTSNASGHAKKITIYYDGVCNLCSGLMDTIATSDKKDMFTGVDASTAELPPGVTKEDAMHDIHVVDEEGRAHRGIDGVLKVFETYPQLKFLATIGRLPGFYVLGKALYRCVEQTRYYIWGRKK